MSQANRNSAVGKRARTDGSRREDDWTCPSCGNVNFSFRTTCNMHNCSQPRPANHNAKSAMRPLPPPVYAPPGSYMGAGAPPPMYIGGSSYGSPHLNGPPLSPYDHFRYSGGSAYQYGYGNRSVGSPYGPPHMSGSLYSSGSMMGHGPMYGMPPPMDRYGLGLPMGNGAMGARPGGFSEERSQRKPEGGRREDDWTCPTCGNLNFAFRNVCNMRKCNTPKPETQGAKSERSKGSKADMPEGSWECKKCNNINYPFRTKCNRQNCGAEKPSKEDTSNGQSDDNNDQ